MRVTTTLIVHIDMNYYCLVNHLIAAGQFKQGLSKSLKICLGGKASTLYKIVFEDSEDQDGLSKMVEKVTNGVFSSVSIEFTDAPKHEVSYGLLVEKTGATELNTKEKSHETVLGESVMDGKSKINILSKLNPNNQWRVKDLTQLKTFIKHLQAYSKIHVKMVQKFESDLEWFKRNKTSIFIELISKYITNINQFSFNSYIIPIEKMSFRNRFKRFGGIGYHYVTRCNFTPSICI